MVREPIVRLYGNIESALGVSATHLDWTMVPYVRKSFYKHYKDGLQYVSTSSSVMPQSLSSDMSIVDPAYKADPAAYAYAMDMTERECYQAVEGMYHNLSMIGRPTRNVGNIAA